MPRGIPRQPPDPVVADLIGVLRSINREMRRQWLPNTRLCPVDGCLLRGREKCPACTVAASPKLCECGRRMRNRAVEKCSRCRKQPAVQEQDVKRGPMRWVKQGLIWRPVYEQSEVA